MHNKYDELQVKAYSVHAKAALKHGDLCQLLMCLLMIKQIEPALWVERLLCAYYILSGDKEILLEYL